LATFNGAKLLRRLLVLVESEVGRVSNLTTLIIHA